MPIRFGAERRASWSERLFDLDFVIWRFADQAEFQRLLKQAWVEAGLRSELLAKFETYIKPSVSQANDPVLAPGLHKDEGGFLFVTETLWRRMPASLRTTIFEHFATAPDRSTGYRLDLKAQTMPAARRELRPDARDAAALDHLLDHLTWYGEAYHVPITPFTWPLLSNLAKTKVFEALETSRNDGLACRVTLARNNVGQLARHFAMGRDANELEAQLNERLRLSGRSRLTVPLEDLMPDFIRRNLNTFATKTGPNCYNCALNVNVDGAHGLRHLTEEQMGSELLNRYRFVSPSEPLAAGDLLLFAKELGDFYKPDALHVATYLADDLVFTKNGLTKFRPYKFQTLRDLVKNYFPDGVHLMVAYRPVGPGERPIGTNRFYARHDYYFAHDKLIYAEIKYDPTAPRLERERLVGRYLRDWMTETQRQAIARLRDDPAAKDVRPTVEAVLALDATYRAVADDLATVEFHPGRPVPANTAGLESLLKQPKLYAWQIVALTYLHDHHRADYGDVLDRLAVKFGLTFAGDSTCGPDLATAG